MITPFITNFVLIIYLTSIHIVGLINILIELLIISASAYPLHKADPSLPKQSLYMP